MTEPVETLIAYTSDSWAIERTLRFFQASFWTASLIGPDNYVAQASHSQSQIHLARRFYRAFKWVDCWTSVFSTPERDYGAVHENMRMLRDSTLGLYFFLDMLVLPTALGAVDDKLLTTWVEDLTGNKGGMFAIEKTATSCWFWAIVFTILLAILELGSAPAVPKQAASEKGEKKGSNKITTNENAASPATKARATSAIATDLFTNTLDLLIPANALGYVEVDPVYVSIGMATSSLITMSAIWRRIYAEKERAV